MDGGRAADGSRSRKGTHVSELLRIGVIGCGDFATRALWPSLRHAPVDIVYACARRPERAQHNKRVFGAQRATTNVDEVLADDTVTALLVIGPPQMQFELGMAALRAGKHIFIEKPPAPTLAQTIELAEAARVAGVQCQIGFQKRYAPGYSCPYHGGRPGVRLRSAGQDQLFALANGRLAHAPYDYERAPNRSGPVFLG